MIASSIKELYKDPIFNENTSCELTSLYIIHNLKFLKYNQTAVFSISNIGTYTSFVDEIMQGNFVLEVALYKRSHTFILFKEDGEMYLASSYLNRYKSRIKCIPKTSLYDLYRIEFLDNTSLHSSLFDVEEIPCMGLPMRFATIKINYNNF